ncbi:MAG: PEP-CTERM sorting domain-containing protein, partial [Puniceicoccales bacterium]
FVLQFGTFDIAAFNNLTPEQQMDFTIVSALLNTNVAQTVEFDANGEIFAVPAATLPLPLAGNATTGDQLYTLVYSTVDNNQFGVFTATPTATVWQVPPDLSVTTLTNSVFAASGTAIVGSFDGNNALLINAVPEPSTYALLAGGMALALVAYRRRRVA